MTRFKISKSYIKKKKRGFIWFGLYMLLVFMGSAVAAGSIELAVLLGLVYILLMGSIPFMAWRPKLKALQSHVLQLGNESLIFQTGPINIDVPYSILKSGTCNFSGKGLTAIVLRLEGGAIVRLENYEDMAALHRIIQEKAPGLEYKMRRWIHV